MFKLCRFVFFNGVNMSYFISLFAPNFQMLFTMHYVAWFINRVRLKETCWCLRGGCGGRLELVCARVRGRRAVSMAASTHSPRPPFHFPLKKTPHNINISLFPPPPDYIIPSACKDI